jgi:hypothetical protein
MTKANKMKKTVTNQEVINLITAAFDVDGSPIKIGKVARQKKALEILENRENYYNDYDTVNGFDVHNCILIIAYPNTDL